MERAKKAIEGFIGTLPLAAKRIKGYLAAERWNEIADRSNSSWVTRFSGGTLYIATENPALAQDMVFKKAGIIEKLNKAVGDGAVKELKITISGKP